MADIFSFQIPIIWSPDSDNWEEECNEMFERSIVTNDFVCGKVDAEYFADFLASQYIDVDSFVDGWGAELET